MQTLIFATGNKNKLNEIKHIIGDKYNIKSLKDINFMGEIPETQPTIEGNAMQKAEFIHNIANCNCFADDTGLEVEALNGQPGVHSARYSDSEENNKFKLLENLKNHENRNARFRTVVALILDNQKYTFEGIINGKITKEPIGKKGFGYDSVFMPDGYNITFAQMSADEKNKISHRALAIKKLNNFLISKNQ